jgi:hypothetical protein
VEKEAESKRSKYDNFFLETITLYITSVLAGPFLQGEVPPPLPCPSDALPFFSICSSALPFMTNVDIFFVNTSALFICGSRFEQ